jgi:uncharacterized protein
MAVVSLHTYPVKSLAAVDVDRAEVQSRGLRGDRRFMLIDDDGQFVTQRQEPLLARVRVSIDHSLTLTCDGRSVAVPTPPLGRTVSSTVWRDTLDLVVVDAATPFLRAAFPSLSLRLVWLPDNVKRPVNRAFGGVGDDVSLADGYPVHLVNLASVRSLSTSIGARVDPTRFRANVVVDGDEPFDEDGWLQIRIGAVTFDVVKPCARCVMTTVDQPSAVLDAVQEPLRWLSEHRLSADRRAPGALFGWNLIPRGRGTIQRNDVVEVISRREKPWPLRAHSASGAG